jgi:hypothetical protein
LFLDYRSLLRDLAKIHRIDLRIKWSERKSGEDHAPVWTATATGKVFFLTSTPKLFTDSERLNSYSLQMAVHGHQPVNFSARTKDDAQEACAKKLLEDFGWL